MDPEGDCRQHDFRIAEMPMAPLWVWLFFNERPAMETFAGGALVLVAILGNIILELRTSTSTGWMK